jgi:hypothetical protein
MGDEHDLEKTDPESSVRQKVLNGWLGQECATLSGTLQRMQVIGLESPILEIRSPFSFVTKTPVVAFYAKLDSVLRLYE